jgi:hypothetical protein
LIELPRGAAMVAPHAEETPCAEMQPEFASFLKPLEWQLLQSQTLARFCGHA